MSKETAYVDIEAEDFLDLVYGEREAWVDLPAKVAQYWVPFHVEWPNEGAVTRRIDSSLRDREDLYYSVAQFAQRGRRIEEVLPSHWLWADLDEVHPTQGARLGALPTVAVESSPGRYQALWRLDRELKPKLLERLNRGLSYALDADRGGWDLTQVLRLPGTRNFKYASAPIVRVLWIKEDLVYDPRRIWAAVKEHVPAHELDSAVAVLPRKPLSRRAKLLLRASAAEVVEGERSAKLWELECLLAEAGYSEDESFKLLWDCAWNKWRDASSGEGRLRRDVRKAMAYVARKSALAAGDRSNRPEGANRENEKGGRDGADSAESGVGDDGSDRGDAVRTGDRLPDEAVDSSGDTGADVRDGRGLPWIGYSSFLAMSMEEPKWLIEDIWVADSHGIIGGEPKTSKTTLSIAMALAVASGEPFLGRYPVGKQGPVLVVQEETAPWKVQDTMRKMAAFMGLLDKEDVHSRAATEGGLGTSVLELDFPRDLPLKLLNNFGFDLAVEEHRQFLEAEVEELSPTLIILDPLYLLLGGANENQSHELRPFLKWLMQLRYEHNCAIALIHHFSKQNTGPGVVQRRSGQRLMGNATLHGWVDSAMYLSQRTGVGTSGEGRAGWTEVRLEREFRAMAPVGALDIGVRMGDVGNLDMEVEIQGWDLMGLIRDRVRDEPGVTIARLADELNLDRRTLLARIRGDEHSGIAVEGGKKGRGMTWRLTLEGAGGAGGNENG